MQLPPPEHQCGDLDQFILHPDQPMRFHIGWDWIAQYPEALLHYESVVPMITWDCEPDFVLLERHEIFPIIENSRETVWQNAKCNWTHRP